MRIPIDKIVINKEILARTEVKPDFVEELANNMAEVGQLNPIIVRPGRDGTYELIDGLHRLAAAKKLGWRDIEATVVNLNEVDALMYALSANIARKEMDPMEEAEVIYKLVFKYGLSEKEVAKRVGKSVKWVSERLMLKLNLSNEVRKLLNEGKLSLSHAVVIARIPDPEKQVEFARLIIANKWSVEKASEELISFLNDTIYTIGYEGLNRDEFIRILKENDIKVVIDVREQAEYVNPQFSEEVLKVVLPQQGIYYEHLPELGAPKVIREPYVEGKIPHECFKAYYTYYMEKNLDKLLGLVEKYRRVGRIALMCAERYPTPRGGQKHYCHRHFIAEKLLSMGIFRKRGDL